MPVIDEWKFEVDSGGFQPMYGPPDQGITWGGEMATSGTVRASGTVRGEATFPGAAHVAVNARAWTTEKPIAFIFEDLTPLPNPPDSVADLGNVTFTLGVPASAYRVIPSGPNHHLAYMLTMYTDSMAIRINRTALAPTSAFVLSHPTTQGVNCSRATVSGLVPSISAHEGMNREAGSHTGLFLNKLDTYALGPIVEQVLGEQAVTHFEFAPRVATQREAALVSADSADHPPYIPTLPCTLIF